MVQFAKQQALALVAELALGDVVVDAKDKRRPAVAVALDNAPARCDPADRMKPFDPIFAKIVVAAAQRVAEARLGLIDIAGIDGAQDIPCLQSV